MLQADKQVLLSGLKRNALELRQKELDFNVERLTNLATQSSVIAGFAFESMVEMEIPENTHWLLSSVYFCFGAAAMSLALYVLCICSFLCVFGHRLALQGPQGSLERAVHGLRGQRQHIFSMAGVSLMFLVGASITMAWIKMGAAGPIVTFIFIAFSAAIGYKLQDLFVAFDIPADMIVTGATRVANSSSDGAVVDLSLIPTKDNRSYKRLKDEETTRETQQTFNGGGDEEHQLAQSRSRGVHHEGYLFKKTDPGFFAALDARWRRRYFVLNGTELFYFKEWEDYGAAGFEMAMNKSSPICIERHFASAISDLQTLKLDGENRFDLVPVDDPLGRSLQLQAGTREEMYEWLAALNEGRSSCRSVTVGSARMLHTENRIT